MIQNGHPTVAASVQKYVSPQARQLKKLTVFLQPGFKFSKKDSTDLAQLRLTPSPVCCCQREELCADTVGGQP